MFKNNFSYFIWLAAVIAVAIVLFWFFGLRALPYEAGGVQSENGTSLPSDASSSERMVQNNAAHYRLVIPMSWYVEDSGGTGLALYPDYDPKAGTQPECKVEISALLNQSDLMLGDWLTAYLRQDPTADIAEISQSPSQVSGRDAITWVGSMNGASSTIAYVAGDGLVYEITPSGIVTSGKGQVTGKDDCLNSLGTVLENFTIISK